MKYVWAVTLVALGLLVGFVLQPGFGRSQAYATFYPVVFVAAFVLGARPAAVTTLLSAAVAYWCFIPPAFQWKWDTQAGSALAFFLITSAIAIHLISRLRAALAGRGARRPSAAEVARVNAVIFADLAARAPQAGALAIAPSRGPRALPPTRAPHRPSERSFDSHEPAGEPAELAPAKPAAHAVAGGERAATLH